MKRILGALIVALAIAGCESIPESTPIDARVAEVVGASANQLSIVNELYKLNCRETSKGSGMWLLNIRVKLKAGSVPMDVMDSPYLALTDENGAIIEDAQMKVGENALDTQAQHILKEFAKKADSSEQVFCFYMNSDDKDVVARIMKSAKSFIIYAGNGSNNSGAPQDIQPVIEEEPVTPNIEAILPSNLKGKVEVTDVSSVSVNSYGYPEIDVTFKLLSTVNTASMASEYGQLWIVGVGQDEQGRNVKELLPNYKEWRTDDSDGIEFKEFLEGEPGNTITMTFTGDNSDGDSDAVEEAIGKVAKFQLKITN